MRKQRHAQRHKHRHKFGRGQGGMTLLEVMVTLGALSVFFLGTLGFYSTTYKHLRIRESILDIVHDAHHIISSIGQDIRQAEELLEDFQVANARSVIAAIKMVPKTSTSEKETVVVYSLDETRPAYLFRSVYVDGKESAVELSTYIHSLKIQPETERLVHVQLELRDTVAGQVRTFQVASAYTMRF